MKKLPDAEPKITGIMMTLNEEFYVRTSLADLLTQCHEVIVMDGGSTDGTLEILEGTAKNTPKLQVIKRPQAVTQMYHPSWNQTQRWNDLIDMAANKWIFILGADEAIQPGISLANIALNSCARGSAFTFPRYAVVDRNRYSPDWWPDRQLRLFKKNSQGGIRFENKPRHCLPKGNMGKGGIKRVNLNQYLIHYHHAFGPKKTNIAKKLRVAPLPKNFRHPKVAIETIVDRDEAGDYTDFNYNFQLYGKMPGPVPEAKK